MPRSQEANANNQNINHQPNNGKGGNPENLLRVYEQTHATSLLVSNSLYRTIRYSTPQPAFNLIEAWRIARDNQRKRVATKEKRPYKRKWQVRKEKESSKQLLTKHKEYGERLGHKYNKYWEYILDLDFYKQGRSDKLGDLVKKAFIKITEWLGIMWEETSHGNAHLTLLLEEETENGIITYLNKFGKIERVGEVLGKGRQARATHKQARGKGETALKAKNIKEVIRIFKLFYIDISIKEKTTQIINKINATNTKTIKQEKTSKNTIESISTEKKEYQPLEEDTKITIKTQIRGIKRLKEYRKGEAQWRLDHQQKGKNKQYFLLDTKYQSHTENIIRDLPVGQIATLILNQGNKHQFFNKLVSKHDELWTEP